MSKRNRKNRSKQTVAHIKAQRGLDRQHFLEENGDMKQWRPPRIVIPDKRKRDLVVRVGANGMAEIYDLVAYRKQKELEKLEKEEPIEEDVGPTLGS